MKFAGRGFAPFFLAFSALILAVPESAWAATSSLPAITINTTSSSEVTNTEVYSGLKLVILLSALGFLPSLIMAMTCFTRVAVVLALTRQALGLQHTPPNQILMGLALFLTIGIMGPIFQTIYTDAIVPYGEDQIGHEEAATRAFKPLKEFMLRHTREQDLSLFIEVTKSELPETPESLGPTIVIPAFIMSELNSAFQISFLIFLPFLVLDMIVSSVLTSMSMITLPPTVVSLPIKLMLFVFIDGWHLIIGNLVKSYHL